MPTTPASHTDPVVYFHVTTQAALASIRDHGLNNTLSYDEVWSNCDDWDDGAYLWDNLTAATRYATDFTTMGHAPVIITINGTGLTVTPDRTGDTPTPGAWHTQHVPPHLITIPDEAETR